jgi:cell fate regulator YaaT (PSP1 superfamily)
MDEMGCFGRGCRILAADSTEMTCNSGCHKLNTFNWLENIPEAHTTSDVVEVRFKNTRKGYYGNANLIRLQKGDVVAVEASPGHDIGIVSLTGELVINQMKKDGVSPKNNEFKKIYRKAKQADIEKWKEAIELENPTMFRARKIASDLKLDMKIGDVEYQGDRTKAIFYYIADDRVDFRELIKVLAEEFKVRIEMRQIGARQEAGRIGGIGACGRELCCSSWIKSFVSVTTNAARYQEVSLNPQKLAGQCSKLKCCLNYELNTYLDAQEDFPDISVPLDTKDGLAYHQKTDVFKRLMWYSYDKNAPINLTCLSIDTIKEAITLNKKGIKIDKLVGIEEVVVTTNGDYQNAVDENLLTRFDEKKEKIHKRRKKKRKPKHKPHQHGQ